MWIFFRILIALLPILSIFLTGYFYPVKQPYTPIFQPANIVFPIIWTYITLSFGLVTAKCLPKLTNSSIVLLLYFIILISLNIWLYIYSLGRFDISFYQLLITSFISVIYLNYFAYDRLKLGLFLLPLPFWLITATSLNGVIYDHTFSG